MRIKQDIICPMTGKVLGTIEDEQITADMLQGYCDTKYVEDQQKAACEAKIAEVKQARDVADNRQIIDPEAKL